MQNIDYVKPCKGRLTGLRSWS